MTRRGWAAYVLLGVGCSTPPSFLGPVSGDGGPPRDASTSVASACADLAAAQCAELSACASVLLQTRYGSTSTCESRLSASCARSLAAPHTGATPSQTEACAQAYAAWSCADYLANVDLPAACAPPIGEEATGGACAFAAECKTGFCALPPSAACGVCASPPTSGEPCSELTSCGRGLVCLPSRVCGTLGLMGAACTQGAPCGPHLSCVGANSTKHTPGTCKAAVTVAGGACDPTAATVAGCDFDEGLVCNGASKQCEALVISPPGGVCDVSNHQFATCVASGTCSTAEAGAVGSCIPAADDGAECSATGVGPACSPPARCIVPANGSASGTCQPDGVATCK
jgi:hypothetical protein